MRPWIHRLVQQLSLPLGLTDLPTSPVCAPSRTPAARAAVPAPAVPGVSCPPAISQRRALAGAPTRPVSTPQRAVQSGPAPRGHGLVVPPTGAGTRALPRTAVGPARRALRLHLDPRHGARAVMSGRCADVCAMLERLAAQEAAACHAG